MGNAMGFGLDYGFKQPFMGNFQGKNWRFRRFFQRNSKIGNINHPPVGMYHLDWTYQKWGIGTLIVSFIKWSSNRKYQSLSKNQGCAELVHFRCSWKFDINLHMWKGLCNLQEQSVRFPGWLFGGPGGLKHFVFIAIFRMLIIWLRTFLLDGAEATNQMVGSCWIWLHVGSLSILFADRSMFAGLRCGL